MKLSTVVVVDDHISSEKKKLDSEDDINDRDVDTEAPKEEQNPLFVNTQKTDEDDNILASKTKPEGSAESPLSSESPDSLGSASPDQLTLTP